MTQVRINVKAKLNTSAVRKEKRNGRDLLIVPSATLPDDIVMNGIKYPAAEIKKSFAMLNRTPAPLGHPKINGQFVSAKDPEGINVGYIGAWNENARQEGGRVLLDKVIDIEVANRTPGGKAVLAAINAGEPVHTSTGLLCELDASNSDDCKRVAKNLFFDHDAILLNEEGAATPDQGVGMLVNGEQLEVVNSAIEDADRELDWAGMRLLEAFDRTTKASVWERMKAAMLGVLASEREPDNNRKDDDMTAVTKEQFDDLSVKVNTLSEAVGKLDIAGAVANAIKPLIDAQAALVANEAAKAETEKKDLVATIVKANLLTEAVANELTVNALKELAAKAKTGKATALNSAPINHQSNASAFKLPKAED